MKFLRPENENRIKDLSNGGKMKLIVQVQLKKSQTNVKLHFQAKIDEFLMLHEICFGCSSELR